MSNTFGIDKQSPKWSNLVITEQDHGETGCCCECQIAARYSAVVTDARGGKERSSYICQRQVIWRSIVGSC